MVADSENHDNGNGNGNGHSARSSDENAGVSSSIPSKPRPSKTVLVFLISILICYGFVFLLHGGATYFCASRASSASDSICIEGDSSGESSGVSSGESSGKSSTKKKVLEGQTELSPSLDSFEDICQTINYALKSMQTVLPLVVHLEMMRADDTTSNTCPVELQTEKKSKKTKRIRKFWSRLVSKLKKKKTKKQKEPTSNNVNNLFSPRYETYTEKQLGLVRRLSVHVREYVGDDAFDLRVKSVAWGGQEDNDWYSLHKKGKNNKKSDEMEEDGGYVLASYLKIMGWPEDLQTTFPFRLCKTGCTSARALAHTLEWREKFKPWLVTPSALSENRVGWIYHRGHSPSPADAQVGPAIVWFRAGLHKAQDKEAYLRVIINTLESAVVDALQRSQNQMGRFNIVLDSTNFRISYMPGLHDVKRAFTILQDHFPDRLGHILIANLSGPARLFLNMLLPIITEDVRKKIHIVPNDHDKRILMFADLVGEEFIPEWLGGMDDWAFQAEDYYGMRPEHTKGTDEEGMRYLTTMPYHA